MEYIVQTILQPPSWNFGIWTQSATCSPVHLITDAGQVPGLVQPVVFILHIRVRVLGPFLGEALIANEGRVVVARKPIALDPGFAVVSGTPIGKPDPW